MHDDLTLRQVKKEWHGSYRSYLIGFVASMILTLLSFYLVYSKTTGSIYVLTLLALAQAIFQMRFFLHLGQEDKPRWETWVFFFMLTTLLIISIGTIIIMNDLNARMMP